MLIVEIVLCPYVVVLCLSLSSSTHLNSVTLKLRAVEGHKNFLIYIYMYLHVQT